MHRKTLLALAILAVLTTVAGVVWSADEPAYEPLSLASPTFEPATSTTTEAPALVDSEVLEQRAREPELIEEAFVSTTTTTTAPTSTTTLPPSTTTTTEQSSGTTAPSPTSTTAPSTTSTTQAGGFHAGAESEFAAHINSYRSSAGVSALARSGSLDAYARSWAEQMAANGGISHSNVGSLLGTWSAVGENVGVGSSVSGLFAAFVDSPEHESTIVGEFTHMGIGVYQDADGVLWTTHVFAR